MPPPPLHAVPSPQDSEDVEDRHYDSDFGSPIQSPASVVSVWSEGKKPPNSKRRHAVGILLLLATVFLWSASSFLASVRPPFIASSATWRVNKS
jgi:solute carrier family 35 protein F5